MEHTPTPWVVYDDMCIALPEGHPLWAEDDNHDLAECYSADQKHDEANAAFIVHCVNNHDALVEALTVCMQAVDSAHNDPEAGLPSKGWHWWMRAHAALKAAKL